MTMNRRSLITGLVSLVVTAPSIVRATSIIPVKVMPTESKLQEWLRLYPAVYDFGEHINCRCSIVVWKQIP